MDTSHKGGLDRHRGYTSAEAGVSETIAFLASMGWHLTSDPALLRFKGDAVLNDDFVVARYSHGPATFKYTPPKDLPTGNRIVLHACLAGMLTLQATTTSADLNPLDVAIVQPEEITGAECRSTTTCMFVIFRSAEARKHQEMLTGQSSEVYLRILKAATFALLQDPPKGLQPGFIQIQRGLEELAKATAVRADLRADTDSLNAVYRRGLALIGSMATDNNTSVESIAHDLHVSRSYLLRAFKAKGTTPSATLRNERLGNARRLLEEGSSTKEAAALSGFGSARNLTGALRADT
ncbi:helix-turn-helix domain-containing protein [Brevibacterium aurantiacum]|uniref:Helix-turn-helix domain-containing protein n=1 Tax=Brevibacterium aurantiacum TaxID=273384 RepID=A0A556CCY0_BREAU|nr:helix-turn-helix domain-containing protein [Brevibacterium aurantiacum]TSI14908.1 helix-turn-helix domain-containing protein [Brevibacterium aurantiacum]